MMKNHNPYMKVDLLGRIYIKDEIIFYDKLLTFSCINDFGQFFIASCIDDINETEEWIFLPITEGRMIQGLNGNIEAYKLFKEPEGEFLWKVLFPSTNYETGIAIKVEPNELNDDDLPDHGIMYKRIIDIEKTHCENELIKMAVQERREILDISLEPEGTHAHEIDSTVLGEILLQTQKLINLIGYRKGVSSKNIPNNIKEKNKMSVTNTYAASFGIRLKSNELANLLNESELKENISILIKLMNAKDKKNELSDILKGLNPSVPKIYKDFLKILRKSNTSIKTYGAFPSKEYIESAFSIKDIENSINVLENDIREIDKEEELSGNIVAIDSLRKKFTFISENEDTISGKINDEINVMEYILPKQAKIKLKMKIRLDDIIGKEDIAYELTEITYIK